MIISLIFVGCSATGGTKTVITNTTLATAFDGTTADLSTLVEAVAGTAGIVAEEISLTALDGVFTDDSVAITLDSTDISAELQVLAMTNTIKTAIDNILSLGDNTVAGLSKLSKVSVVIVNALTATATVTFTVEEGYEFEDKNTSKTLTLNLTGNFDGTKNKESYHIKIQLVLVCEFLLLQRYYQNSNHIDLYTCIFLSIFNIK